MRAWRQTSRVESILIVEDEPGVAAVMSRTLLELGYDVVVVNHGPEALEQVRRCDFDLVLLDLELTDISSLLLLQRLVRLRRAPHVVAVTTLPSAETWGRCMDLGADDCLGSPFALDELVACVRTILREPGPHKTIQTTAVRKLLERAWKGSTQSDTSGETARREGR